MFVSAGEKKIILKRSRFLNAVGFLCRFILDRRPLLFLNIKLTFSRIACRMFVRNLKINKMEIQFYIHPKSNRQLYTGKILGFAAGLNIYNKVQK
jgi:hypothetical protein